MADQPENIITVPSNWTTAWGQSQPSSSLEYSNGVQIAISQWDITLMFLRTLPTGPVTADASGELKLDASNVQARLVSGVVLTPQHAKALVKALQANVEQYEQQFGKLPDVEVEIRTTTGGGPDHPADQEASPKEDQQPGGEADDSVANEEGQK